MKTRRMMITALVLMACTGFADEVKLRNGTVLQGTVRQLGDKVEVTTAHGKIVVPLAQVQPKPAKPVPIDEQIAAIMSDVDAPRTRLFGEPPVPAVQQAKVSARLDARSGASNKTIKRGWQAPWGSYEKGYNRSVRIDVDVSTVGRIEYPAQLRWYVVGKPLNGNNRRVVKKGVKEVQVTNRPEKIEIDSGTVTAQDNNYLALGQRDTSGSRVEGWIVQLCDMSGKVIEQRASAAFLLDWSRTAGLE